MVTKWVLVGAGLLLLVVGVVWTLQGVDLLAGSAMSGSTTWAVIGPIVGVIGLVMLARGLRRSSGPRSDA